MKKVFLALAVVTVALVACNNEGDKKSDATPKDTAVVAPKDTAVVAPKDTTPVAAPAAPAAPAVKPN